MNFISITLFFWFGIFFVIYAISPLFLRRYLLLAFSLAVFLFAAPLSGWITLVSVGFDYLLARRLQPGRKHRLITLSLAIGLNVILLLIFKYRIWTPLSAQAQDFLNKALIPLGFSYLVFKKISYLIDVYRGSLISEVKLLDYLQFLFFIGDLFAGPINRAQEMICQFTALAPLREECLAAGAKQFVWGLFKKIVVADRCAHLADTVFASSADPSGAQILLGTLLFSIQIYADFSGYTDMALGIARSLGIHMRPNFNLPYSSVSIKEFWQRWHISLSQWLRDYIFLPTAFKLSAILKTESRLGVKNETWTYCISSVLTMVLCGLWHGPRLTYILWGSAHGLWLIFSQLKRNSKKRLRRIKKTKSTNHITIFFQRLFTFSLISLLWIVFRCETPSVAFKRLQVLFNFNRFLDFSHNSALLENELLLGQTYLFCLLTLLAILLMFLVEYFSGAEDHFSLLPQAPPWIRRPIYVLIALMILNLCLETPYTFIYTQF